MNLLFRTDASVGSGTGHVMRCLALAEALQDAGGHAIFAVADATPALEERLRMEKVEHLRPKVIPGSPDDAKETVELAQKKNASWVVVDGYHFGAEYQSLLKAAGLKLLFVDDNGHGESYSADLVLNQNTHARPGLYRKRDPQTRLLLGPRYAMLRREFTQWGQWKREIPPIARKLLVTLGGSDPGNTTLKVIDALQDVKVDGLEAVVMVGAGNPYLELLERVVVSSGRNVRLVRNASNMAELMASADVAISAAGSTCWEMCLLGLPAILIDLAPNQRAVARRLHALSAAIHLGAATEVSSVQIARALESLIDSRKGRERISHQARNLVDGRGAERVLAFLHEDVRLRRTLPSDSRLLWEWANDPEVRSVSFGSDPIPWEQHVSWLKSKLAEPSALLYIATDQNEQPIGQVRYQLEETRATLSVSLGTEFRGKGYGTKMLFLATEELFQSSSVTAIDAYVKSSNNASLRLFESVGFHRNETKTIQDQPVVHFVLEKSVLP